MENKIKIENKLFFIKFIIDENKNYHHHLHRHVYFTKPLSETVPRSLRLSCGWNLPDK